VRRHLPVSALRSGRHLTISCAAFWPAVMLIAMTVGKHGLRYGRAGADQL